MKVKELRQILNEMMTSDPDSHDEDEIAIVLKEYSIGTISHTKIKSVSIGFDWDSGLFLIDPKESLIRKQNKND